MELAWQATTDALAQIPIPTASPVTGGSRNPLGVLATGGAFCFDPFDLYARELITNPNLLVLGDVGRGKSAMVKTLLHRGLREGQSLAVIDPKGEYRELGGAVRAARLSPGEAGGIDPFAGYGSSAPELATAVLALISLVVRRDPTEVEKAVASAIARHLAVGRKPPSIRQLLYLCERPSLIAAMVPAVLREEAERLMAATGMDLERVVSGDLAGLFSLDGRVEPMAERIVIDLGAAGSGELGALATAAILRSRIADLARGRIGPGYVVLDEAWSVLRDPAIAGSLRSLLKLARAYGASVIAVTHRLSDLAAEAKGLVRECGSVALFSQGRSEAAELEEWFGFDAQRCDLACDLLRGRAIWLLGRREFLVDHLVEPAERGLVDTDARMVAG